MTWEGDLAMEQEAQKGCEHLQDCPKGQVRRAGSLASWESAHHRFTKVWSQSLYPTAVGRVPEPLEKGLGPDDASFTEGLKILTEICVLFAVSGGHNKRLSPIN